jgi:SAM-dependent methyltransferase
MEQEVRRQLGVAASSHARPIPVGRPDWAPDSIDIERPSVARMYDYYLGGSHNFAVDRQTARQVIAAAPDAPLFAQANRAFLRRVVRFLLDSGVEQFLDIGSGIPTVGNVHEIAQAARPDARVVYVDIDPIAVTHSLSILDGNERATAIVGDLRAPEEILRHPRVRELLDFGRPIGVLIVAVLHFVPETADPAGIIARIRNHLAPGSYVAVTVLSPEGRPREETEASAAVYRDADNPLTIRDTGDVVRMLAGFEIMPPGAVPIPRWRPDPADLADEDLSRSVFVGAVGRVP